MDYVVNLTHLLPQAEWIALFVQFHRELTFTYSLYAPTQPLPNVKGLP